MLEMTKESSLMIVTYVNNDQMKLKTNFNQSYINVENFQIDLLLQVCIGKLEIEGKNFLIERTYIPANYNNRNR